MKKISFFISHPIQYFSPLFKSLARVVGVEVYYFSDLSVRGFVDKGFGTEVKWDIPLLDGYRHRFIGSVVRQKPLNNKFLDVFNPQVFRMIKKESASVVVVHGWTYSSTFMAIVAGKLYGKEVWIRAENPLNQEVKSKGVKALVKKGFLKYILFPMADKCLYIGKESRDFFQYYGVKDAKLLYTPYAVNNEFFRTEAERFKGAESAVRAELRIPADKVVILYSGKYIPKKNPMTLLTAFSQMNYRDQCFLVMMGDGELRNEMEKFINVHGLANVLLTGFINQSEVSKYYASCDFFVMCSGIGETWGLSVNEAMNFSKPVIVSSTCGCSRDLVEHGVNGFVYEQNDTSALTSYMDKLAIDPAFREAAGRASAIKIDDYSYDITVQNMLEELGNG
jgi:glycosyltransferase involved in cell wall biosynthesis